ALARQPYCLLARAWQMRRQLQVERLIGSKIGNVQIDMVIHSARLMLLQIGNGDLPIIDEEIGESELARWLFAFRSSRNRGRGLGFLPQRSKVPDTLGVAH